MKKKFLFLIGFLVVTIVVVALSSSLGWLETGENGRSKSQLIEYGDMEFSLVGGCDVQAAFVDGADEYAAPGENMIYTESAPGVWTPGPLTALNKSTITTNLRVHIEYSWWDGDSLELVVYSPTQKADFTVDFAVPANWEYDSATGCWNYLPGGVPGQNVVPAVDLVANPDGVTTALINSMGYSSAIEVGSPYQTKTVTVKLKVEAKQADYVTWQNVF